MAISASDILFVNTAQVGYADLVAANFFGPLQHSNHGVFFFGVSNPNAPKHPNKF